VLLDAGTDLDDLTEELMTQYVPAAHEGDVPAEQM
jgi:hypothetical protein